MRWDQRKVQVLKIVNIGAEGINVNVLNLGKLDEMWCLIAEKERKMFGQLRGLQLNRSNSSHIKGNTPSTKMISLISYKTFKSYREAVATSLTCVESTEKRVHFRWKCILRWKIISNIKLWRACWSCLLSQLTSHPPESLMDLLAFQIW